VPATDIECIVPWRAGCPDRERAWDWLQPRLPYPLRVGAGGEPWVKAEAVNPEIAAASAEVLIVCDADVWCPGLELAVDAVEQGAPWALPHDSVHRLSADGTKAFLAPASEPERERLREDCRNAPVRRKRRTKPGLPQAWDVCQAPYEGIAGGGCLVARRELLLDCPLDPRFVGWGQEDQCWGWALRTMYGTPVRVRAPLVHLWHPPQRRKSRVIGSDENWALRRRYHQALDHPRLMRALLEEVNRDRAPHKSSVCA
jgi:hypothetical protein